MPRQEVREVSGEVRDLVARHALTICPRIRQQRVVLASQAHREVVVDDLLDLMMIEAVAGGDRAHDAASSFDGGECLQDHESVASGHARYQIGIELEPHHGAGVDQSALVVVEPAESRLD